MAIDAGTVALLRSRVSQVPWGFRYAMVSALDE
jgi:hypothetical protein